MFFFRLAFELVELVLLFAFIAFLFYVICDFVYPIFTGGRVKPGWLWAKMKAKPKTNQSQTKEENHDGN